MTFIDEAKKIHNYDYSLVEYVNNNTKVKIICPIHGIFEQTPYKHLKGQGCPYCARNKKLTVEQFIERAIETHGSKYDYSLVEYKNANTKVKIICPIHGIFEQTPRNHWEGQGCPICSIKKVSLINSLTAKQYFNKVNNLYSYKYSYGEYKGLKENLEIYCPTHGKFIVKACNHLYLHAGCPCCNKTASNGEILILEYLKKNNIEFVYQKKFEDLKDKTYLSYDFYIPSKNLLIEYNGEQHYKPIKYFGGNKSFLLQKHHDWMKRKYAKCKEINLLTITYKNDILLMLKENL